MPYICCIIMISNPVICYNKNSIIMRQTFMTNQTP